MIDVTRVRQSKDIMAVIDAKVRRWPARTGVNGDGAKPTRVAITEQTDVWTFPVCALMWNYALAQPGNAIGRDWAA